MKENLGFRSEVDKEEIDWKAGQLGMNRSEFINLALKVLVNFDDEMLKKAERYSEKLRLSLPELITHFVIRRLAEIEVKGAKTDLSEVIPPAAYGHDQEVFINMLKDQFKKEAKNE